MYGFPPPLITELAIPGAEEGRSTCMLDQLEENLLQAQNRMKRYADLKRLERVFQVGDLVYLKMASY